MHATTACGDISDWALDSLYLSSQAPEFSEASKLHKLSPYSFTVIKAIVKPLPILTFHPCSKPQNIRVSKLILFLIVRCQRNVVPCLGQIMETPMSRSK
jgi:hypothetical protein